MHMCALAKDVKQFAWHPIPLNLSLKIRYPF
jgi:hypothetical protein